MDLKNVASLSFFVPEIILSGTILLLIIVDLIARSGRGVAMIALAGCAASLIATLDLYSAQPGWLFHRMMVLDNFSLFFKVVALAATILYKSPLANVATYSSPWLSRPKVLGSSGHLPSAMP